MRYYDGRYLIYDSITGFKASEITEESLELLGGPEAVALKVHESTNLVLPFMKKKSLSDPNNFNIPKWFQNMIQHSDKVDMAIAGLSKQLTKAGVTFTEEDVRAIVHVPLEADAKRSMAVSAKLLAYTSGDMQATTVLRRRVMIDDAPYEHPNETLNQSVNTDKLGVRLPDADVIVSHVIGEPYADTPFHSTYSAYPNRLYRMKQIVNILTSNSNETRLYNINQAIDILKQTYKIDDIPETEIRKLRTSFEILPLSSVIGNPDNDSMEIQPNEKDYYENLVAFIKYHILKFNKEVMSGSSEEEIKAKAQQDFDKGVLPVRLTEYLDTLIFNVLDSNFYHTGNFNYTVKTESKSPYQDDEEVFVAKNDPKQSDLDVVASSYLSISARTFGASVWAEGIVKLMRWGDRKIKNLSVGVNNTQYLDLQTMHTITQQLADLSQFEVSKDEKGRTLDVLALTYCDFKPADSKRAKSYPFLLVGAEYGRVPGIEKLISVTYITTLFDVVRSYTSNNNTIYDLSYVNGKFVDDFDRTDLDTVMLDDLRNGNRKIKISDQLINYAVDNHITKMQGTAFALLRQDDFEEYMSSEPLMERLAETPKPIRTNVVQGSFLSIFQEGAENYDTKDLVELLNWYQAEVYPTHLEAYNKLFGLDMVRYPK